MLNRKVLARNIMNLTDARYFAAWGVDFMSFNLNQDSPYFINMETLLEIKNWVEGPQCLIETNTIEFDELADGYILDLMYQSLPMTKDAIFKIDKNDLKSGLSTGKYIFKLSDYSDITLIDHFEKDNPLSSEILLDITDIHWNELEKLKSYGIAIQGGQEEKVGLKSFDELDKLYDFLLP